MARAGKDMKKVRTRGTATKGIASTLLSSLAILALVLITLGLIATAFGAFFWYSGELPNLATLKEYRPPLVTRVYASNGTVVGEFYVEKRVWVPYARIPRKVIQAFVAAEDARFFEHKGIDFWGMLRASLKNIEAGSIVQGGSTITQQVAKIILLSPERSFIRKIKEVITALRIERSFTKEQILELYLNQIYLGHGAYGIGQVAGTYFSKEITQLNLAEIAMIAGMPRAPARYSPVNYPHRARERQKYVLRRMLAVGYITPKEAKAAEGTPLKVVQQDRSVLEASAYFVEHVRRYIEEKYGTDLLYKGGLTIRTALDVRLQEAAMEAVQEGLRELDKRHGFRGPAQKVKLKAAAEFLTSQPKISQGTEGPETGQIVKGVVEKIDRARGTAWVKLRGFKGRLDLSEANWAMKAPRVSIEPGDVIEVRVEDYDDEKKELVLSLEQEPIVQGALVALEPTTGYIRAMVGGSDFRRSQFNRAVQARRQPGSAFKPIIYAAAMDAGFTPESVIVDSPVSYRAGGPGEYWQPQNYDKEFKGPVSLRRALAESRNVVTVKLLDQIKVDYVVRYARNLGITSPLPPNLSLALGSSGLSLLELTRAYAVFSAMGHLSEPISITEIRDQSNKILEKNSPRLSQVISPETAYTMNLMMQAVIQEGTGRPVRSIGRPAAGKTGTTDEYIDAWFIGYTPQLVAGTWVGYDNRQTLGYGETGARAASPIWLKFMKKAVSPLPPLPFTLSQETATPPLEKAEPLPASMENYDTERPADGGPDAMGR